MEGGAPDNVDPGITKLKDLYKKHKAVTINNVEHTHQLLVAEEIWICPTSGPGPRRRPPPGHPSSS